MITKGGRSGVVQNNFMTEKEKKVENKEFELFCERMTCHGFADFYQARHVWEKLFWAAAMLFATSFFVFQAFIEVSEYIHNPILTSISIETKSELPFPPVYICPMNYPDWKMLGIDGCKEHSFVNLTSFLQPRSGGVLKGTSSRWLEIAATLEAPSVSMGDISTNYKCKTMEDNITIGEYIKWYAMSTDMFIRECSFESTSIDCSKVVTQVLDKEYGVCYLIEVAHGKAMQRIPGNGLSLALDIQTELLEFRPHDHTPGLVDGVNIRIGKMDPAELGGTLLGPGTINRLSLAARKQKLMPYSMGSTPQMCNPTTSRYDVFNGTQVMYSEQLCRADCGLHTIVRTCSCITPFDHRFLKLEVGQLSFCTAEDYDNCIAPNFITREVLSDVHACSEKCYPACEKAEIAISLSNAKFPSVGLLNKLGKSGGFMGDNSDYDFIPDVLEKRKKRSVIDQREDHCRHGPHQPSFCGSIDFSKSERWADNMMIVEIAFEELQYTLIEQGPSRTLTSLVSNIGGQAGLWIGASIFTFIQLLVYCVRICCSHN